MKTSGWKKTWIQTDRGERVEAIAPVIISASRATDIPAFYADWFMHRLKTGYCQWINPFNQQPQYISFQETRAIVFWSKNPAPMIKYLPDLDQQQINYYFTCTVNDYEHEGLEPGVPPLKNRLETFIRLAGLIGKDRVIWRFDPLVLTDRISIDTLVEKIRRIGDQLHPCTNKLVISFADITAYRKVQNNLKKSGINYRPFSEAAMNEIAEKLQRLNQNWHLTIATCAEAINLEKYGIINNKCIDDDLMIKCFSSDKKLMDFLDWPPIEADLFAAGRRTAEQPSLKDPGQRAACGCIRSKDIGQYNTCMHLCAYCYANTTPEIVKNNYAQRQRFADSILK